MGYTAGQAARAVGVATSTITSALKKGKISGHRDEHGAWSIDPAELHRVYPPLATQEVERPSVEQHASLRLDSDNRALERLIDALQEQVQDLREQRDKWQEEAHALRMLLPVQVQAPPPSDPAMPSQSPASGPQSIVPSFWRRLLSRTPPKI